MSKKSSRYAKKNVSRMPTFYVLPKNQKQDLLIESIKYNDIIVAVGYAGTGKTYCSAGTAAQLYLQGEFDKIVLARANLPTGKSLGSFPGDIHDKLTPWLMPMLDVLRDSLGAGRYENMLRSGQIELQPVETIRGRSFTKAFVLVDEAQNLTIEEIKAITTRLGEGSKLVLMGDPTQSDVKNGKDLEKFCKLVIDSGIDLPVVEFGLEDIVRSDIVKDLVTMFVENGL